MGLGTGGAARQLQGAVLCHLRPQCAVLARISRRGGLVPRCVLRSSRRRHRGDRRHAQMGHAVQLEIPGGKLRRRRLPYLMESSLGDPDRVRRRLSRQSRPERRDAFPGQWPLHHRRGPEHDRRPSRTGDPSLRGGDRTGDEETPRPAPGTRQADRRHGISQLFDVAAHLSDLPCLASRGPDKTEVWAWVFADKAAPPEVKEAIRLAGVRVFGPSGTFEQDDMDNWQGCTQSGREGWPGAITSATKWAWGTSASTRSWGRWPATIATAKAIIADSIAAGRS